LASGRHAARCGGTTWGAGRGVPYPQAAPPASLLSMKVPFHSDRGAAVTLKPRATQPGRHRDRRHGCSSPRRSSPIRRRRSPSPGKNVASRSSSSGSPRMSSRRFRRMAAGLPPEPEAAPEPPPPVSARAPGPRRLRARSRARLRARIPSAPGKRDPERACERGPERALASAVPERPPTAPRPSGPLRTADDPADRRAHGVSAADRRAAAVAHRSRSTRCSGWRAMPTPRRSASAGMDLMRRYHPDLVARRNAPAITHLAEELTILANRAYDRLRVAAGRRGPGDVGRAGAHHAAGLAGRVSTDISSSTSGLPREARADATERRQGPAGRADPGAGGAGRGRRGPSSRRARAMLGDGDADKTRKRCSPPRCACIRAAGRCARCTTSRRRSARPRQG